MVPNKVSNGLYLYCCDCGEAWATFSNAGPQSCRSCGTKSKGHWYRAVMGLQQEPELEAVTVESEAQDEPK